MTREFKVPVKAPSIIKDGGTSSQYLMADGSVVTFSAQGIQGLSGSQGIMGSQGTQGLSGTQGIAGLQGTVGTQGIQGIQGIIGDDGFVAQPTAPANTSLLWLNTDEPAAVGLERIVAGTNIIINPTGGTGIVTINASGGAVDDDQNIIATNMF
jgi:hypothetical protein